MEIAEIHNSDWITVREGEWNAEDWSTAGSLSFSFPPWPHRAPLPTPRSRPGGPRGGGKLGAV